MKRRIPGLHGKSQNCESILVVFSWSALIWSSIAGIRNGRFTFCGSLSLNRENTRAVHSLGVSTALPKRFGNSAGSCGISAMTPI